MPPSTGLPTISFEKRKLHTCDTCRKRKVKCDGRRPWCRACQRLSLLCSFDNSNASTRINRRTLFNRRKQQEDIKIETGSKTPLSCLFRNVLPCSLIQHVSHALDRQLSARTIFPYLSEIANRSGYQNLFGDISGVCHRYRKALDSYLQDVSTFTLHGEHLGSKTIQDCYDLWDQIFFGQSTIFLLLLTRNDLIDMHQPKIVRELLVGGTAMLAVNAGLMPTKILLTAFGQVTRAASLCETTPARLPSFKALVFATIVTSFFGLTPQLEHLSKLSESLGLRMDLHKQDAYVEMDADTSRGISTIWWTLLQFNTTIYLVTGKPIRLNSHHITAPLPSWPDSSRLSVVRHGAQLAILYERFHIYFHTLSALGPNEEKNKFERNFERELDYWFNGLPEKLKELPCEDLNDFLICNIHILYCALKCQLWLRRVFIEKNVDAAEICDLAARRILQVALEQTRATKGFQAITTFYVDIAYNVLFLFAGIFADHSNVKTDYALMKCTMPQFRGFILPSIASELYVGWSIMLDTIRKLMERYSISSSNDCCSLDEISCSSLPVNEHESR